MKTINLLNIHEIYKRITDVTLVCKVDTQIQKVIFAFVCFVELRKQHFLCVFIWNISDHECGSNVKPYYKWKNPTSLSYYLVCREKLIYQEIERALLDFFEIQTISQRNRSITRRVHGTCCWWRRVTFRDWFWWFLAAGNFVGYYVPRLRAWIVKLDGQSCVLNY